MRFIMVFLNRSKTIGREEAHPVASFDESSARTQTLQLCQYIGNMCVIENLRNGSIRVQCCNVVKVVEFHWKYVYARRTYLFVTYHLYGTNRF